MKNFIRLFIIFLLGITFVDKADGSHRAMDVPKSILQYGCYPVVESQCPAHMFCYVDFRYPKYGQCACRDWSLKRLAPPVNDGSELADPIGYDDCVNYGLINIIQSIIQIIITYFNVDITLSYGLMIYRVAKNKGMKPNSSCFTLIFCFLTTFGEALRQLYILGAVTRWDAKESFLDGVFYWARVLTTCFSTWAAFECYATWFDLYEKSRTMSRKSSLFVNIMKFIFRFYGIAWAVFYNKQVFGSTKATYNRLTNAINQWGKVGVCAIAAPLLVRALCKNMRDVTNPNWKAAAAIRYVAIYDILTNFMFYQLADYWLQVGLYINGPRSMVNGIFTVMWSMGAVYIKYVWFNYMRFAHRRYLTNYGSSRVSDFFGFTTIGMKGASGASVLSVFGASSASTRESAAVSAVSSASAVESDEKA